MCPLLGVSAQGGFTVLCNVIFLDATKRSFLSEQLKQQLKDKRMVFSKNELQLTSTVGQGIVMLSLVDISLTQ